jgi:N-acetylated-alpha-linked acidic dipeptidase
MRPRRTLVICSWDGEEVGLTGSTEWGEQFADELRAKAVAYINVDEATSGPNFHGQAVASLAPMLVETSRTLRDPSGKSLYEAWKATATKEKEEGRQSSQMNDSGVTDGQLADTRIGSGSDHTVFLNFVGMPVIGLQFDGDYGVYHSAYDDFYWMNHFGDPGYRYHTLMSQLWGVTALRLANADLLPFDFASYANNIRQFVNELAVKNKTVILSEVAAPRSGAATQSKDPVPAYSTRGPAGSFHQGFVSGSPAASSSTDSLHLTAVLEAIDTFEASGKKLNESLNRKLASGPIDPKLAATLNHGMMQVERNWLNPDGIPGRPWFKHILYGARFTYAHLELPGLTEAVEAKDWLTAKQQAEILERALKTNTKLLQELNDTVNSR